MLNLVAFLPVPSFSTLMLDKICLLMDDNCLAVDKICPVTDNIYLWMSNIVPGIAPFLSFEIAIWGVMV
jgi:hypothetical protein